MKLEGLHKLNVPRERVYVALTDPDTIKRCIPGCEHLEKIDEHTYSATFRASLGDFDESLQGTVRLEAMRLRERWRIVFEGISPSVFLKGSGEIELKRKRKVTIVNYYGEIQVDATPASVSLIRIQTSAKLTACQIFKQLEAEARITAGETPPKYGFRRWPLRWFR